MRSCLQYTIQFLTSEKWGFTSTLIARLQNWLLNWASMCTCEVKPVQDDNTTRSIILKKDADFAFDDALNRDIRAIGPNPTELERPLNVLRHQQVVQICISNDRVKLLRDILSSTQPGNIVDPKLLRELGRLLDVEYVFLPQIVYVTTDNATRFNFAGFTFILTGWISIEGTLQLWHTETGALAWQSVAEASLSSENLSGVSPPTQDAMNALFIAVVDGFLAAERETVVRGQVEPPSPTTPRSAEAADATAIKAISNDSSEIGRAHV